MLALEDPEHERLENIYELKNVLKETENTVDGDNIDKLESLLNDLSLRTDEERTEDQESVVLSTYHRNRSQRERFGVESCLHSGNGRRHFSKWLS